MNTETQQQRPKPYPPVRRSRKRRRKLLPILVLLLIAAALAAAICLLIRSCGTGSGVSAGTASEPADYYAAGEENTIPVYDEKLTQTGTVLRGQKVSVDKAQAIEDNGVKYYEMDGGGYLCEKNLAEALENVVPEMKRYVRTSMNLTDEPDSLTLGALAEKGTQLTVTGYDKLEEDGSVHMYLVDTGTQTGYIRPCYLTDDLDEAKDPYDQRGLTAAHLGRGNLYGGGKAGTLDYYPREKLNNPDNVMPGKCYTLYLNSEPETIAAVDDYIEYAKSTKINAFVVDIMDGKSIGYASDVMASYSPTSCANANNTLSTYQAAIKKLKDAGFYVIGRITTFNDKYFAQDHPECAITDASGAPLEFSGTYWPSAFSRYAWEYKVALAREAVTLFGFNEIQFDYVRFPDGTYAYEQDNNIDYRNAYDESKAQAVQRFLMYACDVLHESGVYVSADVFGETSNPYVAAYGQYFPAISNVVDVISGMPYPDHYAEDGDYLPWEHPYDTIADWAESVVKRQKEIATPAVVRTWVQAYDAIRWPYNEYGATEVGAEIQALLDNGLTSGFITWNPSASLTKYKALQSVFDALQ